MKTLKFRPELIELIRKGEKTVTWRLLDDKDLRIGDDIQIIDWDSRLAVGTARIASVIVVPLLEAWQHHATGHESFEDEVELLSTYRTYYGGRVTLSTDVKVIRFEDIRFVDVMHS